MHITNMSSAMGMSLNVSVTHQSNNTNTKPNSPMNGSSDTLSISKSARSAFQNQSKMGGVIDSLLKQKQNIIDSKNSLIERTTQSSHSLDSIQDQLKDFDKQLQTIDQQIAKYSFKEQQKNLEDDQKAGQIDEPKTEQEIINERLHTIVAVSQDVNQIEVISSTRNKMHGEAKVLSKEIELDEARSGSASASKHERLATIDAKISDMNEQLGEAVRDTEETIKDQAAQAITTEIKPSEEKNIERTEQLASYKEIQRLAEDSEKQQLEVRI